MLLPEWGSLLNLSAFARKEALHQAEYSHRIGSDIQEFFAEYFNIPFPLPKQDMVALPDHSLAMEHWGLIVYMWVNVTARVSSTVVCEIINRNFAPLLLSAYSDSYTHWKIWSIGEISVFDEVGKWYQYISCQHCIIVQQSTEACQEITLHW